MAAGSYNVVVSPGPSELIPLDDLIVIEEGRAHRMELRIPGTKLTGQVVHAEDDTPFEGTTFIVATPTDVRDGVAVRHRGSALRTHTSRDGLFELSGLDAGWYEVRASPRGDAHEPASQVVDLTSGTSREIVFRIRKLHDTARLFVTVLDPEGSPAPQVTFVSVERPFPDTERARDLRSESSQPGTYELRLEPGSYLIEVRKPGYYREELKVQLQDDQVLKQVVSLRALSEE